MTSCRGERRAGRVQPTDLASWSPDNCRRVLFTNADFVGGGTQNLLRKTAGHVLPRPLTPLEPKALEDALRQAAGA